jgi:hypothetical protein
MDIPTFHQFKITVESALGQSLTYPAVEAVRDFHDSWNSFIELIANGQLSVRVEPFLLARSYPQYQRYQIWTAGGIFLALISLVLIFAWFFWQAGLPLLIVAAVMYWVSKRIMHRDVKQFKAELMKNAALKPAAGGFAGLCANYVSGVIHVSTPFYTAHWPQHPSNAITGKRTVIETKKT